jgi:hypothetical protein
MMSLKQRATVVSALSHLGLVVSHGVKEFSGKNSPEKKSPKKIPELKFPIGETNNVI